MDEHKMIEMIERKFESIEDKLRNSFQGIKKDKEKLEKDIVSLQDQLNNINYNKEISELRVYFQKEINLLKERFFDSEEKTKKLDSKLNKQDLRGSVKKELESIFDKKFDKELKKQKDKVEDEKNEILLKIKQLEKSFDGEIKSQESRSEKVVDQINSSLEKLQSEFKKKIVDSRQESLDEIETLKHQIAYLKGKVGKQKTDVSSGVFTKNSSDKNSKSLKNSSTSKKKGFLTKVIDGLAD
jgi:DNA repair exonuclease SbcCD ATPase subunit